MLTTLAQPERLTFSPVTGAVITVIVIAVITAIAAWIYRSVPAAKRRPIAITMMVVGGVLLASTLLRAWDVIEGSDVVDAIMIGLLIGGFLILIVGFALYRAVTLGSIAPAAPPAAPAAPPPPAITPPRPRR